MQNCSDYLPEKTESELIRAARDGSTAAFAELARRTRPRLVNAARAILKSAEEAEDAVQNAFWKAYEHLSTFRGDSSFNTWMMSIVLNQARMRLREMRRARLVSFDDASEPAPPLVDPSPSVEESYAGEEMLRALRQEIRRLPAQLRQIMLMHVENLSMPEAAERLGVSLPAAKARLFRARMHLGSRMRPYTHTPAVAA